MRSLVVITALALASVAAGCRRGQISRASRPAARDAAELAVAGPLLVEIRGRYEALAGLPAIKGIMTSDQAGHQLADGTWSVTSYVSSAEVIEAIRAQGLTVKVLQTAEQIAREGERIARELQAGERADARRDRR